VEMLYDKLPGRAKPISL